MKPGTLLDRLANREVLVSDGAMGSLLIAKGLQPGASPEELNATHPDWIADISTMYRQAGADILQTNTFGGSPIRLKQHQLESRCREFNESAVQIARQSANNSAFIAASCGPCGQLLKPYGELDPEEVYESFCTQMNFLAAAGVDAILIETMTDLGEAVIAMKAARNTAPGVPVLVTLSFDETPRGFFTIMGNSIESVAGELEKNGADVIGSNCGNGIETMTRIAQEFRSVSKLPIIIQSNAGLPSLVDGKLQHPESPEFFEPHVRTLAEMGVAIIGGCCGTTPDHIKAIRRVANEINAGRSKRAED